MRQPTPLTRDVVLVGGGHAHALLLRRWGMHPLPGARLTLIDPHPTAPYTGMLPGHIAGHYTREELDIDLVRLARFAGARLVLGRAEGIDRDAGRIAVTGRPPVAFDIASLDIGVHSDMAELAGFADHGVAAKPLDRLAARWSAFLGDLAAGRVPAEAVVIGGGVAGVELAMAMAHAMRAHLRPRVTVLEAGRALDSVAAGTARTLRARLARMGVALREHVRVARVEAGGVVLADGERIGAAITVGTAGARPHPWLAATGLALDSGHVAVDDRLRSITDPAIYAAGDCAHLIAAPRPKAGLYAVRAAPVLHHNIRADLTGRRRPRRFHPQRDYLKLISLGGKSAVADRGGLHLAGRPLWRLKDRIDRRFMTRLRDLPAMAPPPAPREAARGVAAGLAGQPLCAGCGAKLGAGVLRAALAARPGAARADVLAGPGDDAALLRTGGSLQAITTDHLRAFTEDPYLFARIAAVHALGDLWAMGAAPQAAFLNVTLPEMRPAMQAETLREIMAGAGEVLAEAGAAVAGGHSAAGAETTLGLTLTGLVAARPVTLAGARPGDALLLTRPLGSGVLLAGEMQLRARGPDVADALAEMARPQMAAAAILADANAMTDVTGFGLAGHLMEMLEASGVAAELDLAAIPLYSGAETLAAAGIRSTLAPANRAVADRMSYPEAARADLLFDPQTAGGLLAAVPAKNAEAVLASLAETGARPAAIGRIAAGEPWITVR